MSNWYITQKEAGRAFEFMRGVGLSGAMAVPSLMGLHGPKTPAPATRPTIVQPSEKTVSQPSPAPAPQPQSPPPQSSSQTESPQPSHQTTSNTLNLSEVAAALAQDEGAIDHPYNDHLGNPTIGIGHLIIPGNDQKLKQVLGNEYQAVMSGKKPMTPEQMQSLLVLDLGEAKKSAEIACRFHKLELSKLPAPLQSVLVRMAYQMGSRLPSKANPKAGGLAAFKGMFQAIQAGNYEAAANHMKNSTWGRQTPGRASRTADEVASLAALH